MGIPGFLGHFSLCSDEDRAKRYRKPFAEQENLTDETVMLAMLGTKHTLTILLASLIENGPERRTKK